MAFPLWPLYLGFGNLAHAVPPRKASILQIAFELQMNAAAAAQLDAQREIARSRLLHRAAGNARDSSGVVFLTNALQMALERHCGQDGSALSHFSRHSR